MRDKVNTAEWILVTGTNGKTTTVQLAATLLAANGLRAAPCGNIGVPVLDAVRDPGGFDVLVVELSSYQLHHLPTAGPGRTAPVGERRAERRRRPPRLARLVRGVPRREGAPCTRTPRSRACTTAPTRRRCRMVEDAEVDEGARAIGFGLDVPGPSDFGVVDGILVRPCLPRRPPHRRARDHTVDELEPRGLAAPHVVANILAASALARSFGVPVGRHPRRARRVPPRRAPHRDGGGRRRHPLDRRLEGDEPARRRGIARAPSAGSVWIVGGLLKGVDVDELVAAHAARLRAAIVIGVDRAALVARVRATRARTARVRGGRGRH